MYACVRGHIGLRAHTLKNTHTHTLSVSVAHRHSTMLYVVSFLQQTNTALFRLSVNDNLKHTKKHQMCLCVCGYVCVCVRVCICVNFHGHVLNEKYRCVCVGFYLK